MTDRNRNDVNTEPAKKFARVTKINIQLKTFQK